jgi:hypothetical protein
MPRKLVSSYLSELYLTMKAQAFISTVLVAPAAATLLFHASTRALCLMRAASRDVAQITTFRSAGPPRL